MFSKRKNKTHIKQTTSTLTLITQYNVNSVFRRRRTTTATTTTVTSKRTEIMKKKEHKVSVISSQYILTYKQIIRILLN